jgi:hypothetical protein
MSGTWGGLHRSPLWFSVSSEYQACEVVDLLKHTGRRSTTYDHVVACRDHFLRYSSTDGFVAPFGDTMLLVTDPVELLNPTLPTEISPAKAWRLPIAVLAGLGFTVLVVTKPRRIKTPAG